MIGLDTNVLVRFITQDDPQQSALANDVFEHRLSVDDPGYVSAVVVAETSWVLERSYRLSAGAIALVLERVLQTESLVVEHEQEVFTAMIALKEGRGSFADALIGALHRRAGCDHTLTFDRHAARLPGFVQLTQT